MRNDGVPAVDYAGVVAPFVEHTEVETEYGSVVHVPAYRTLVGRYAHQAVFIELDVGETLGESFQHLIGREIVVKSHHGHGVLHSGIVRVESDEVAHSHVVQFVEHLRAVERFPAGAAVLSALVQHGHDHRDALRLAVGGAYDALEIREMLVRSHRDLLAEEIVRNAVIGDVADDEKILAAQRLHDHALAFAVGETRAGGVDDECVFFQRSVNVHRFVPLDEVFVDEFGEFARTGSGDESQRPLRSCGAQGKFGCHLRPPEFSF